MVFTVRRGVVKSFTADAEGGTRAPADIGDSPGSVPK